MLLPPHNDDPVRVLIVEDHPTFGEVLRVLLEQDERLIVVDSVRTATAACGHPLLDDVDVALVDIGLPDLDGVSLMLRLQKLNPALRVLIMSGSGESQTSADALAQGADAYLEKGSLHGDLIEAILRAGGHAAGAPTVS